MHASSLSRRQWLACALVVALLAVVAAWPGIHNAFAYDDMYIVKGNGRVHSLHGLWKALREQYWPPQYATDGYRPFTIIAFGLQWAVDNGAPWVFHATNIALAAAASVLFWWVAAMLIPAGWALAAAALFAVHPVHVEAVANVVGQSELWVGVLTLLSTGLYLQARARGTVSWARWAAIAASYAAACMFKENGIVLPAILVAAELTVVRDDRRVRDRLVAMRPALLVLTLIAVAFLWARGTVRGGDLAGFAPYYPFRILNTDPLNRVLTVMNVVPDWVRLLAWPANLSIDYSPADVEIATGWSIAQLPGILLSLGILGLALLARRRCPPAAFGVAFFVIAFLPASNLLMTAGILLAERNLFVPSAGALLAAAAALALLVQRAREGARSPRVAGALVPSAAVVVAALVALGTWRSMTRTRVWKDNDTLLAHEVRAHPSGYRINYLMGASHFQKKMKREGEPYFYRSMKLFPYDPQVSFILAENYRESRICEPAIIYYRRTIALEPNFSPPYRGLGWCLGMTGDWAGARAVTTDAMRRWGATPQLREIYRWVSAMQREERKKSPAARGASRVRTNASTSRARASGKVRVASQSAR